MFYLSLVFSMEKELPAIELGEGKVVDDGLNILLVQYLERL